MREKERPDSPRMAAPGASDSPYAPSRPPASKSNHITGNATTTTTTPPRLPSAAAAAAPAPTPPPATASEPPLPPPPPQPPASKYPSYKPHIPFSARLAPRLDLSTVERKGHTSRNGGAALSAREGGKKVRPHGLQEGPTFRPTEEEFKDPMAYIRAIAPEGRKYGICKIIPPDAWRPNFAIDTEVCVRVIQLRTLRGRLGLLLLPSPLFAVECYVWRDADLEPEISLSHTTPGAEFRRRQYVSLSGNFAAVSLTSRAGTRTNLNYLDQLSKFHKQQGMNLNRFPSVDKRPLDLYKLKKAVETRGGFEKVCKLKKWAEIGRDLGYSGKIMSSLSTSLKNSYSKWLEPYEEYLRKAKPGVQQQLEAENGGPFTPPATSATKKSNEPTPASNRGQDSPAMRASAALNASIKASEESPKPGFATEQPQAVSGFTPVNAGGFTPVNVTPSSFQPVNAQPTIKSEKDDSGPLGGSATHTPEHRPSPTFPNLSNGHGLKRTISHDSVQNGSSSGEVNGEHDGSDGMTGRRSKRQKRDGAGPPTVAGSHMSLLRPLQPRMSGALQSPPVNPSADANTKPGERCEGCGQPEDPAQLLLCDGCDVGYHRACTSDPPGSTASRMSGTAPSHDWHCPKCLVGTGEFGFEEGGIYGLKQFQEKANNFKASYFGPKMPFDPVLNRKREATEDDVEREFWRLVESITETVEVEYGADIHSTTHGSGFPQAETEPTDPYATDPWNLNLLPLHPESLFRFIKSDISGMTVPWLYVGMCFSTFCWHNEDHYTYSANYQHFGATKTWYGIPGADAERFEKAMKEAVPELFEQQPDLLFQLVTLLPPDQLRKAGVSVYALDQRAGQFVVTFPQAYHAGFNHGFNFNEAVNFAPSDWEPFGQAGVERLHEFRRQPCFSHDELLMTAAERDTTIKTAKWLAPALQRMLSRELAQRQDFHRRHAAKDHYCQLNDLEDLDGKKYVEGEVEDKPRCGMAFNDQDPTDLPEEDYQCVHCKAYCYLARVKCQKSGKILCVLHAGAYKCCDAESDGCLLSHEHELTYRYSDDELPTIVQKVSDRARSPEAWHEKLEKVLDDEPRPALKTLRSLVSEGERIPYELPGLADLKAYVERCAEWVDEAQNYITRKQQNRRKNERAWRRSTHSHHAGGAASSKAAELEERDRELRKIANIEKLLAEADALSFDCPEITTLRERARDIQDFRAQAQAALADYHGRATAHEFEERKGRSTQDMEDLAELGKGFSVDIPEVEQLEAAAAQMRWDDQARALQAQHPPPALGDVQALLVAASALRLAAAAHPLLPFWAEQRELGALWDDKARALVEAEQAPLHQLQALFEQAAKVPVTRALLADVDALLARQRRTHEQILDMHQRSQDADYGRRPRYKQVREVLDALTPPTSKPPGAGELEKEIKRHEDWMRKGKRLFGKANAPLHILKSHMVEVKDRNLNCLGLDDKPRMPVEPSSRANSPEEQESFWSRDLFCICRKPELGMMIECDLCHEW